MFLNNLHQFEILDLHSYTVFQPYDLHILLLPLSHLISLLTYFMYFTGDPEQSKEFHYECAPFDAFFVTQFMRFLKGSSYSAQVRDCVC